MDSLLESVGQTDGIKKKFREEKVHVTCTSTSTIELILSQ